MESKLIALFLSLYLVNLLCPFLFSQLEVSPSDQRSLKEEFSNHPHSTTTTRPRRAVAMFVDSPTYMYGVYSIQTQLKQLHMTSQGVEQVAVIPDDFITNYPTEYNVLQEWLGKDHVHAVNKHFLHDKLHFSLWKGTFNKLWLFNLTDYNQLIVLDSDILIRKSLMHWFDYPMPCAIQTPDDPMTWNSGAMVIQPNATVFQQMLDVLPQVRAYDPTTAAVDTWTATSNTDQNFLSAFFTHSDTHAHFATLPSYASVISSKLKQNRYRYWVQHRRELLETVHFTSVKPWKKFATNERVLCDFLREWQQSVEGMDRYYPRLSPIPSDYLRNCPKDADVPQIQ